MLRPNAGKLVLPNEKLISRRQALPHEYGRHVPINPSLAQYPFCIHSESTIELSLLVLLTYVQPAQEGTFKVFAKATRKEVSTWYTCLWEMGQRVALLVGQKRWEILKMSHGTLGGI